VNSFLPLRGIFARAASIAAQTRSVVSSSFLSPFGFRSSAHCRSARHRGATTGAWAVRWSGCWSRRRETVVASPAASPPTAPRPPDRWVMNQAVVLRDGAAVFEDLLDDASRVEAMTTPAPSWTSPIYGRPQEPCGDSRPAEPQQCPPPPPPLTALAAPGPGTRASPVRSYPVLVDVCVPISTALQHPDQTAAHRPVSRLACRALRQVELQDRSPAKETGKMTTHRSCYCAAMGRAASRENAR